MAKIPVLTAKQAEQVLKQAGFAFVRQKGAHRIYQRGRRLVVVPWHPGDIKRGTTKSIIAQSGMEIEEFMKFL